MKKGAADLISGALLLSQNRQTNTRKAETTPHLILTRLSGPFIAQQILLAIETSNNHSTTTIAQNIN